MSSIKKLMCNPPAEAVASCGDDKLAGMFRGAGDAIRYLTETGAHPDARAEFTHAVLTIEQEYMDRRQNLAAKMMGRMQAQFDWLAAEVDKPDPNGRRS